MSIIFLFGDFCLLYKSKKKSVAVWWKMFDSTDFGKFFL